ncbi:1-acyl-sn-glycerol-3-phosphate acyltransferase [uncultured Tateyamaria sp.]|uniref:lysophospholipid acyltransferase family protein n=1 Tax=uncultured Tateyamaria sp. TaxID=455651 RepID=UPI00261738AA|nr:lysophospholipid acyltransferase family protein [uncultured Tateyamaria sp.]
MTTTWEGDQPPESQNISAMGWVRVAVRGSIILLTVLTGLLVLLPLRVIERPFCGANRPLSPWVTQAVCRVSLFWMGLRFGRSGKPMQGEGAIVANHTSWLDIFVLNASDRVYFVSKSEVARWPGIGFLARITGTVFIARDRRQAKEQTALFEARIRAGHRLLFFPEGTSTDGQQVLPFKTTLFAAFFAPELANRMSVQAVSVNYHPPEGADRRLYGWWGDMDFASHLLTTLAQGRQGCVEVVYHPAIKVSDVADRKMLAARTEEQVRAGHAVTQRTR